MHLFSGHRIVVERIEYCRPGSQTNEETTEKWNNVVFVEHDQLSKFELESDNDKQSETDDGRQSTFVIEFVDSNNDERRTFVFFVVE